MITAEDVAELVEQKGHVSMVEIMRLAGDWGEGNKDLQWQENLYLWVDMSDGLVEVMMEVQERKLIPPHPDEIRGQWPMSHFIDGGILNIPIAKRIPKGGYKKPHWLPVVFQPGQRCSDKDCLMESAK